jgi:hypothetical protein
MIILALFKNLLGWTMKQQADCDKVLFPQAVSEKPHAGTQHKERQQRL